MADISNLDRRQIKNLWESGLPIAQIIRLLPYRLTDARQMIRELRADGTLAPRSKREAAKQRLAEAVSNGMTDLEELAETYGYSCGTVKDYLSQAKVYRGRPKKYKQRDLNAQTEAIISALRKGERTPRQIAADFGLSRQRIYAIKANFFGKI